MINGGLDIALAVIMGYFFLRGIFRGVVKEVVAVLGFFVAFWVASQYWPLGEEHLKAIFDLPGQRGAVSFILVFLVVYFLISIISIFVDKIVKLTISPLASALLGAVVGVLKGVLVCAIILMGVQTFLGPNEKFFTNSKLWPYFEPVTNQARAWMPEALRGLMNMKKNLPIIGDERPEAPALPALPGLDAVDWKSIQDILASRPEAVSSAWRDKLRGLSGGESLSREDINRFVSDHPELFSGQGSAPAAAPSWPQPAVD